MALLWIDGFDAYGTTTGSAPAPTGVLARKYSAVTYESSFDVETGRLGGYCLEFGSSSQYFTTPALTVNATMIVGLAVMYAAWSTATLLAFMDGTTLGMNIRITANGEIAVYRGSTLLETTSGSGLFLGGWFYIEFKVVCGAAGSYELRINGVDKASDPSVNTKAGSNDYHTAFRVGEIAAIQVTHQVDDLYCLDGTAGQDDFLGNQRVVTIFPNGVTGGVNEKQTIAIDATSGTFTLTYVDQTTGNIAFDASAATVATALKALSNIEDADVTVTGGPGPTTDWVVEFTGALALTDVVALTGDGTNLVGGTTTVTVTETVKGSTEADFTPSAVADHYTLVDENPSDDDTTYVESAVTGDTDLWDYEAVAGLGIIAGLQINTQARETDAQNFTLKTVARSGSTVSANAGEVVGSTNYKSLRRILETDPATAAAWLAAGISAAKFGVRVG